ncbi:MAG: transaldolase, partial [Chloroflexi bacterium]|nr:transaldolase [Chloroflexota bacterium]
MNIPSNSLPDTVLDRLLKTAPQLEIWWDSSPLVYPSWVEKLLASTPPEQHDLLRQQLRLLFDPQAPQNTRFTGVTTNPPLTLAAIKDDPQRWAAWVAAYHRQHPAHDAQQVFWALYKEVVRLGAETYYPLYVASRGAYGHLSAQVNPHDFFDIGAMVQQALELRSLSGNIAIKIPGTQQGMQAIR